MHINPYLFFNGTCAEALRHYAKVLGGDVVLMTFRGSPMEGQVPPEQLDHVMHGRITAPGLVLMGGDAPPDRYKPMQGMSVSVNVDTPEEAERIWAGLSEGGQVMMDLAETFWATRFGVVTDRFGTGWMVNCEKKMA